MEVLFIEELYEMKNKILNLLECNVRVMMDGILIR